MYIRSKYHPSGKAVYGQYGWHKWEEPVKVHSQSISIAQVVGWIVVILVSGYVLSVTGLSQLAYSFLF